MKKLVWRQYLDLKFWICSTPKQNLNLAHKTQRITFKLHIERKTAMHTVVTVAHYNGNG